ncbi:MAG: beta-ketoacyl synthase N-terminal-like domain-containing protein [Candidatus Eisenbacteria bacterium]
MSGGARTESIAITAASVLSPVGSDTAQTCASIRARINRFAEWPPFPVAGGRDSPEAAEPAVLAASKRFPAELEGRDRLTAMLLACLQDFLLEARLTREDLAHTPFLLACPRPDDAVAAWHLESTYVEDVFRRASLPKPPLIAIDATGHTGVFRLLEQAVALLRAGRCDRCIVGGADTWFSASRIAALDRARRLKSSRNPDGFVPGEAAGLVLLERAGGARALGLLDGPGLGEEPQTSGGDRHSTGSGLAGSIAALPAGGAWSRVYCDLNGESYRFAEWGVARARLGERFAETIALIHPADCVGDVGAASGALLLACGVEAFRRGYADTERVLLWTASDERERAAVQVTASA